MRVMRSTRRLASVTLGALFVPLIMTGRDLTGHDRPTTDVGIGPQMRATHTALPKGLEWPTPADPQDLYKRQCMPCHGAGGKGDGPAAPAFRPRPANLTDSEFMDSRSDAELREVLQFGKGSMPAFGRVLEPDDIDSLIVYLRELGD